MRCNPTCNAPSKQRTASVRQGRLTLGPSAAINGIWTRSPGGRNPPGRGNGQLTSLAGWHADGTRVRSLAQIYGPSARIVAVPRHSGRHGGGGSGGPDRREGKAGSLHRASRAATGRCAVYTDLYIFTALVFPRP